MFVIDECGTFIYSTNMKLSLGNAIIAWDVGTRLYLPVSDWQFNQKEVIYVFDGY